mgnify:CR=1 FL=1
MTDLKLSMGLDAVRAAMRKNCDTCRNKTEVQFGDWERINNKNKFVVSGTGSHCNYNRAFTEDCELYDELRDEK